MQPDQVVDGARLTLRDVRQAINEFRDSSWAALVRTRNHLLGTITITGIVTYLLLTVAISGRGADAPANLTTDAFAAAATLYLIGAVVGLFNRLYAESSSDNSIEDYGLTVARTGLTPVLSGLAALGGVLIIAILPAALSGDILAPTTTVVTQSSTPAENVARIARDGGGENRIGRGNGHSRERLTGRGLRRRVGSGIGHEHGPHTR